MAKFYAVLAAHCGLVFCLLQIIHYGIIFFTSHFVETIVVFLECFVISSTTFQFTKRWCLKEEIVVKKKAVFITGCDSGFGHLLAQRLDKKGFKVFASCLDPCGPGATELKAILSAESKVFGLDVTKQESIQQALKFVKENLDSYELWAVVNNAGVSKGFTMKLSSTQDFEDCLNVNALGHVRVTKAFLNLLRTSKGRIIHVNSISSRFPISHILPYCMSKHAAAAFNDCLRLELDSVGIKVISVEPSAFQTAMTESNAVEKYFESKLSEYKDEFGENHGKTTTDNNLKFLKFFMKNVSKNVSLVIDDLEHAICSQYPESIYNTSPSVLGIMCLKIHGVLPPFLQDFLYRTVPKIVCKFY